MKYLIILTFLLSFSTAHADLSTSVVSSWKLDESSGNAADAVGSNTLTNNNTAVYATGIINNGIDLEQTSNQYLSIADASQSGLDMTTDFSIQAWIKMESLVADFETIVGKSALSSGGYWFALNDAATTKKIDMRFLNGANVTQVQTTDTFGAANVGQWIHLVATVTVASGASGITLYVNGTATSTTTLLNNATAVTDSTSPFTVGMFADGTNYDFDGVVDEVTVWNRALSAAEVTSLYNSGTGLQYPFSVASVLQTIRRIMNYGFIKLNNGRMTIYSK